VRVAATIGAEVRECHREKIVSALSEIEVDDRIEK
jgi:hypothetical protein